MFSCTDWVSCLNDNEAEKHPIIACISSITEHIHIQGNLGIDCYLRQGGASKGESFIFNYQGETWIIFSVIREKWRTIMVTQHLFRVEVPKLKHKTLTWDGVIQRWNECEYSICPGASAQNDVTVSGWFIDAEKVLVISCAVRIFVQCIMH